MEHIIVRFLIFIVSFFMFFAGCGHSGGDSSTEPSNIDYGYLRLHNAQFLDNHTIRWPGTIYVNYNGIPNSESEFNRWITVSDGKIAFQFVSYIPDSGINMQMGDTLPGTCGVTTIFYDSSGVIRSARITLNPIYVFCTSTIAHEAGHAIGFFNHTSDGGLMDPDGGNGLITDPVANMIKALYSLNYGTDISNMQLLSKSSLRYSPGSGKIYSITISSKCR